MKRAKITMIILMTLGLMIIMHKVTYGNVITTITTKTISNSCTEYKEENTTVNTYDDFASYNKSNNDYNEEIISDVNESVTPKNNSEEGITIVESKIIDLVNKERVRVGVAPLEFDTQLYKIAKYKSSDMAQNHYFNHTSLNGITFTDLLNKFSYGYIKAGENIAYSYENYPEAFYNMWVNSQGHYLNMINGEYNHCSVAISYDNITGRYYGTMNFSVK